jgi:DNA-binding HxlR family transcriptional regulator
VPYLGGTHWRATHDTSNCSISRTLDVVGEKLTILVLHETCYGVARFADFEQIMKCPRNLLSGRLRKLVEEGALSTEPYQSQGTRRRLEYVLTPKGKRLMPALITMLEWGDEYAADSEGPAMYVNHRGCGRNVHIELRCSENHRIVEADDLEPAHGPAFRLAPSAAE